MSDNKLNTTQNDTAFSDFTKKYSASEEDISSIESLFLELSSEQKKPKAEEKPIFTEEDSSTADSEMDSLVDYFESNMPKNYKPKEHIDTAVHSSEVNTEDIAPPEQKNQKPPVEPAKPIRGVPSSRIRTENRRVIFSEDDESTRDMFKEDKKNIDELDAPFVISTTETIASIGETASDAELRQQGFSEEDIKLYRNERNKALGIDKKEKGLKKLKSDFIPRKTDPTGEKVRKIIMLTSLITLIGCGIFFAWNFKQKKDITNIPKVEESTAQSDLTQEQMWEKIKANYPNVIFPDGMNIKYAELYGKNQDTVGWLEIPNTNISTPVVQFKGDESRDEEFYLKHDFYKKSNKYGNPFMEWADDAVALSQNTVIHGHNMYDGLMFADLEKYLTLEGYKSSPIINFNTLYGNYRWKIFAAVVTNGNSTGDNGYLFNFTVTCFTNESKMSSFIESVLERSVLDTGVDVNSSDKLLTLNTCCYKVNGVELDDARLAIFARLVRPGEDPNIDLTKSKMREDVRFPQMYYDKKGISNPYINAYQWKSTD